MRALRAVLIVSGVALLVLLTFIWPFNAGAAGTCGLTNPAFCDTFDQPQNGGTRSGDLNSAVWGVSRATGRMNIGSENNAWTPGTLLGCSGSVFSPPPRDVVICNGQVREVTNDGGGVTVLAMYPKQPFDFAGRTGTVVFDVSNNSGGSHASWPEFWITDRPVPAPFNHEDSWQSLPRNGFGIRFAGYVDGNGTPNSCPGGSPTYMGVDDGNIIRNYVRSGMQIRGFDCVRRATQPGQMNHYEIRVSQGQIDVYGTDAGTTSPLKHLAAIQNANLSFTRGLIWIEDAHYAGDKFGANQQTNTFVWDNVGFDGPFTYRDLSYDALDNNTAGPPGTINLGRSSLPGQQVRWDVLGLDNSVASETQRVMFNFYSYSKPASFNVTVNGHQHTFNNPYPDGVVYSWRTVDFDIPRSELVNETNVVQLGSSVALVTSNVNIVLVNVGGVPPPPSTATPTPQTTFTPVPATNTPVSTSTPTPTSILCEIRTRINGIEQQPAGVWVQKPPEFCQ